MYSKKLLFLTVSANQQQRTNSPNIRSNFWNPTFYSGFRIKLYQTKSGVSNFTCVVENNFSLQRWHFTVSEQLVHRAVARKTIEAKDP